MTRTSIIVMAAVAGTLAIAGCSRSDRASQGQREDYSTQGQAPGPQSPTYYPGQDRPQSGIEPQPGRASGGGVDEPGRASGGGMVQDLSSSSITTKDQFEDVAEKHIDHLEDMLDNFKSKADSLTGVAKDKFNQQADVAEQGLNNLKSSVDKLDDNNWSAMRQTIQQDLKRVESEINKLGSHLNKP